MKHSIAKSILLFILLISLSFTGVMIFFTVKNASDDAYEHSQLRASKAAEAISSLYSGNSENVLFENEEMKKIILDAMQAFLKEDNLFLLYIIIPNENDSTMSYPYIVGTEDAQPIVKKLKAHPIQKRSGFSDSIISIMKGESSKENLEMNNEFGHVISTSVPLFDNNQNVIAVVGADVSVSMTQLSLMGSLPSKLFASLIIGFLSPLLLYFIMKKKVIEPTQKISNAMMEFGRDGNYDTPLLEIDSNDEFGLIENSFNNMAINIRDNIHRIKEYTEIQNRQNYELRAASKIQQGFLPKPHFENSVSLIDACMIPAKNIGGDFYDYFEYNDQTILIIADVSGKGLSGAIFMASAITLIRGLVKEYTDPHDVLRAVNEELEHTNPNMMFVTVFLAYIDMPNGIIRYCNAGHNPPYIISDGKLKTLDASGGLPLGIMTDEIYETSEEILPLGSTLFMYTDGVNEASDTSSNFFGLERLKGLLKKSGGIDTIKLVQKELNNFANGCEQYDDITMLTFTSKAQTLVLPAKKACFADLKSWILDDKNTPSDIRKALCLMAEEIFINIASYAYDNADGKVLIRRQIYPDGSCILQFTDNGAFFDPTKDILNIDEYDPFSQVGGLGRFVVDSMSDAWHYINIDNNNILLIIKKTDMSDQQA